MAMAVKLFESKRISSGVAASLAEAYLGQAKKLDLPESLELPEF